MKLNILDLGTLSYGQTLQIQKSIFDLRISGKIEDTIILVEHTPTVTLGRESVEDESFSIPKSIIEKFVEVFQTNRGGKATFHGKGQAVFYPIINLKENSIYVREFIDTIKKIVVEYLKCEFGLNAHSESENYTGVWIDNSKIMALGIYIFRYVTMHGFALNVNTDLSYFNMIVPCGLQDRGVTSIKKELGYEVNMNRVKEGIVRSFCTEFGFECQNIQYNDLKKLGVAIEHI